MSSFNTSSSPSYSRSKNLPWSRFSTNASWKIQRQFHSNMILQNIPAQRPKLSNLYSRKKYWNNIFTYFGCGLSHAHLQIQYIIYSTKTSKHTQQQFSPNLVSRLPLNFLTPGLLKKEFIRTGWMSFLLLTRDQQCQRTRVACTHVTTAYRNSDSENIN